MGTAIVPMLASGELRDGSAFLATKLMGCSAEDEELDSAQEQAMLDALELNHQSEILHNDVHTGNVLLPRPHEQLQQPLWTDFRISVMRHNRDAHAHELQLCRRLLAKHPKGAQQSMWVQSPLQSTASTGRAPQAPGYALHVSTGSFVMAVTTHCE